jgi:hypothetical protein
MLERIPAGNNLYDETGRVKDVDAAHEMAEAEQYHRDVDAEGLFRVSKRELAEREDDIETVGRQTLADKEQQRGVDQEWELDQQSKLALHDDFVERNLQQDGLSSEVWLALSSEAQQRIEVGWRRRELRSSEWKLEQRLKPLVGKRVISFEVGDLGDVVVQFDDGHILSFQSWNARDDEADYDAIEVKKEET